jgi:putative effector of murein hydrolase
MAQPASTLTGPPATRPALPGRLITSTRLVVTDDAVCARVTRLAWQVVVAQLAGLGAAVLVSFLVRSVAVAAGVAACPAYRAGGWVGMAALVVVTGWLVWRSVERSGPGAGGGGL